MKKNLLKVSIVGVSIFSLGFFALNTSPERQFTPREVSEVGVYGAKGGMEYVHSMRANQVTGEVDPKDVAAALNELDQMASLNKTSAIGFSWDFKGPDNVGGRSRAILIDRNNNNTVFVAGVDGGIFKSTNGGLTWVPVGDDMSVISVVCLAQAPNGDLYAGTGENVTSGSTGTKSSGKTGGGIYKSTDGGNTWNVLTSTQPPANNTNSIWSAVSKIGVDPTNSSRIYAANMGGLQRSDDGGQTWSNPLAPLLQRSVDLQVGSDGSVWVNIGSGTYYSANGNDNSFTEISKQFASSTDLPRSSTRMSYALSPSDPDVMYIVQTAATNVGLGFDKLYRTEDRGATWEIIMQKTSSFDPTCNGSSYCQANWNLMLGVNPNDKNHIFFGGIDVWEWKKSSGWRKVDGAYPFYIHADKHEIKWDPTNSNTVYMVTDGGVSKSINGGFTWETMNRNFGTQQFYHIGIGQDRSMIGGSQDNRSVIIDGTGNTAEASFPCGPVLDINGQNPFLGDGGWSFISWLDPEQSYTEYQEGRMGRSRNGGESYFQFWDQRMLANGTPGNASPAFSAFIMPYHVHETANDPLSADSIYFVARSVVKSLGYKSDTNHTGNLDKPQASSMFVASSFRVESGGLILTSDGNGNLSGSGSGTFNPTTGEYDFTFSSTPIAEILIFCDVEYASGSEIIVNSKINELPFKYKLSANLSSNDSVRIQDRVQSIVAVGLNGSVWMTRKAHDWTESKVEWWKLAEFTGTFNSTVRAIKISHDGKYIWAGTFEGQLIRMANIDKARSALTADIVLGADSNLLETDYTIVKSYGRTITDIAIDPNNSDRVVVTLGNYGNANYIEMSSNATSTNPTFITKQGNMPKFPVYSATFDIGDSDNLIIGTEYGVFATDNISAGSPTWTEENNGIPRVSVFTLVQYLTDNNSSTDFTEYQGDIFAGTHGRGIYRSTALMTSKPVDIPEQEEVVFTQSKGLNVYPNPAVDYTNVELNLNGAMDVAIFVRDINGRLVNQLKFGKMPAGKREVRVNTSELSAGTYMITVQQGDDVKSGKFVVTK